MDGKKKTQVSGVDENENEMDVKRYAIMLLKVCVVASQNGR